MATNPANASVLAKRATPAVEAPTAELSHSQELGKSPWGAGTVDEDTLNPESGPPVSPTVAPGNAKLDRFERLMERIRGTVTIHGDIVSPDPETWRVDRGE